MENSLAQGSEAQLSFLPSERFELGFDSLLGRIGDPPDSSQSLTLTSHRVILSNRASGRKSTTLIPLGRLSGIEVVDAARSKIHLGQAMLLLGIGTLLGAGTWFILEEFLLVLIVCSIPLLTGIYLLTGYLFPDHQGELLLHAPGCAARVQFRSPRARNDAYAVAQRLFELIEERSPNQDAPKPEGVDPFESVSRELDR